MSNAILTGAEALDALEEIAYVAPHSYSANVRLDADGNPEPYLSILSQIAIDAAATVVEHQPGSKLVVTGETCYGDELPTTTTLMADRAIDILGVDAGRVVPLSREDGRGLDNTYLQTEALANFFRNQAGQRAVIMPLSYHLKRIVHTAKAYGIDADFVAAEDVLHAVGDHSYDQYLPHIEGLGVSEKALRFINIFDPRGRLLNWMMEKTKGPRLVDVVETDDGLELEQGYSADKLELITQASPI
jgi:hypothetical protein